MAATVTERRTLRLPVLTNPLRPLLLAAAGSARLQRIVTGLPVSRAVVKRYVPGAGQDARRRRDPRDPGVGPGDQHRPPG